MLPTLGDMLESVEYGITEDLRSQGCTGRISWMNGDKDSRFVKIEDSWDKTISYEIIVKKIGASK